MKTQYEKHKERAAQRSRQQAAAGRDIGVIPDIVDPERRARCEFNLRLFCETYLPNRFSLAWGPDHLESLALLDTVCLEGGQYAYAMPRGSGKTSSAEAAALKSALYGHRKFVVLIGATEPLAEALLDSIKSEIETNELLLEDFPEVCFPVRSLEGIHNRAGGQTCEGVRTRIEWAAKSVTFPTIKGSKSSGCTIKVVGITGSIRGMAHNHEGQKIRPDLVIIDDPQTDESARSPSQNITREQVISGAVLGLAGPGKQIAVIMTATVIRPGDMVDRILDNTRHPEWQGRRFSMIKSFPERMDLWEKYHDILSEGLRTGKKRELATEFYKQNKKEMDRGAEVSWEARFDPDQISAIQHAMELFLVNPEAFWSEYQNKPKEETKENVSLPINGTAVAERLNRLNRGIVPLDATTLTASIDVQQEILFWTVMAWDASGGGSIVDYGTFPPQPVNRFSASDPNPSLSQRFPNLPMEARIYAGLEEIAKTVLLKSWKRDGEGVLTIEKALVDSGYETDTVYKWVRETSAKHIVLASKGWSARASSKQIDEWGASPGDKVGKGWRLRASTGKHRSRLFLFDANHWKTYLAERLRTPLGVPSAVLLFGNSSAAHSLFCDHLESETPTRFTVKGRTIDEWDLRPGRPDNHWFDCAVGCTAAASLLGISVGVHSSKPVKTETKQKRKWSEIAAEKRRMRA
jgi:hypothetical protein